MSIGKYLGTCAIVPDQSQTWEITKDSVKKM